MLPDLLLDCYQCIKWDIEAAIVHASNGNFYRAERNVLYACNDLAGTIELIKRKMSL